MAAMRQGMVLLFTIAFFAIALSVACGSNNPNNQGAAPTATAPYGAPPGYPPGYGPQGAPPGYATAPPPGYPPPGGYAQPGGYPQQPAPGPAPAPGGAQLSTPGPLALPCQSDATCGLHHCNTQYGKCTFPCQTGTDCLTNNCVMGVCLPGGGS
jgi:hypothetical protein